MHILQGPDDDMEDESDLTVTELKEKSAERSRLHACEMKNKNSNQSEIEERCEEDTGINWGMADDANEDDEPEVDMTKNPFSIESTSDNLSIDDPKKTLRGWFEREGFENPEYKCEEKGYATFTCTVDLPIREVLGADTGNVFKILIFVHLGSIFS